ncbi:hypothetical protein N5C93_31110 [Pseudomonas nitroreducens]|uniref:hypothetical protein n=1 Tax=Pseudomonas nitroreducens TaxID=46680 RepID=UPI0024489AB6|nr:hypothetical protein [Pseudomonas nitroreducens]MDH1077288.1 hypothetical protein [Pseudomonas nitroreducens]
MRMSLDLKNIKARHFGLFLVLIAVLILGFIGTREYRLIRSLEYVESNFKALRNQYQQFDDSETENFMKNYEIFASDSQNVMMNILRYNYYGHRSEADSAMGYIASLQKMAAVYRGHWKVWMAESRAKSMASDVTGDPMLTNSEKYIKLKEIKDSLVDWINTYNPSDKEVNIAIQDIGEYGAAVKKFCEECDIPSFDSGL